MDGDLWVRDAVLNELEFEPKLDAAGIGISVKGGVVTLSGHVASYAQKLAAEAAAKRVRGVRAIAQDIEVHLPPEARMDDAEIARRALSILGWNVAPPETDVGVRVEDGVVTLNGEVNWSYQRQDTEAAIRRLRGVVGIDNQIKVRSGLSVPDIRARLSRALERNAELGADEIRIGIDGGKVTLEGEVRSWRERELIEDAAWSTPGVNDVIDRLTLA